MGDYGIKVNQHDTNTDLRYMNNTVFKSDLSNIGTQEDLPPSVNPNMNSSDQKQQATDSIKNEESNGNHSESSDSIKRDDQDILINSLSNLALNENTQVISSLNTYNSNINQNNSFWSNDDMYIKPSLHDHEHNGGIMQSYSPMQYGQQITPNRPMGHYMSQQRNQYMPTNGPMQQKQTNYTNWNNSSLPNAQSGWPMNPWANLPPPPPPPQHQQSGNQPNNQRHRQQSNDKKPFTPNNIYANQPMPKYIPRPPRNQQYPSMIQQMPAQKNLLDYSPYDDQHRDHPQDLGMPLSNYDHMRQFSVEPELIRDINKFDVIKGGSKNSYGGAAVTASASGSTLDDQSNYLMNPGGHGQMPQHAGERIERYSRKVFVGGLPPDIDEEEITGAFMRFGHLVVDWPHKAESKSYFPPKGYCFLLFQDEISVQSLIEACYIDDDKFYWYVSSPTMKDKPVQIRPWNLSDSDFVMDGSQPLDPRKTIFVGGVPRPLRAIELAMIMDRLYGGICYAGIDTDPELKYPKGAGRVAFSHQQSYIAAISARFVQLQHADIDKRVEVKPYVLDDQMCDECQGARCAGKFAPFFCANVTCLQYYCEQCWSQIHASPGREFHKPLVKEGADRPRSVPFRWC